MPLHALLRLQRDEIYQSLNNSMNEILTHLENFINELENTNYPRDQTRLLRISLHAMDHSMMTNQYQRFFVELNRFISKVKEIPANPQMNQILNNVDQILSDWNKTFNDWIYQIDMVMENLIEIDADQSLINAIHRMARDLWRSKENYDFSDAIDQYFIFINTLTQYFIKNPHMYEKYAKIGEIN